MTEQEIRRMHRPGDRWQNARWPPGTPDAVVGEVAAGCVIWKERGGSTAQAIPAATLTTEAGWRRAVPK